MNYVCDGKVGVIIHRGWGSGWSTGTHPEHRNILLFHPLLVEAVHKFHNGICDLSQLYADIYFAFQMLGLDIKFLEGYRLEKLVVLWLDPGCEFLVQEYDGVETILKKESINWIQA